MSSEIQISFHKIQFYMQMKKTYNCTNCSVWPWKQRLFWWYNISFYFPTVFIQSNNAYVIFFFGSIGFTLGTPSVSDVWYRNSSITLSAHNIVLNFISIESQDSGKQIFHVLSRSYFNFSFSVFDSFIDVIFLQKFLTCNLSNILRILIFSSSLYRGSKNVYLILHL